MQELFGNAMFDVEHALVMYAYNFFTLPAEGIYNKGLLEHYNPYLPLSYYWFNLTHWYIAKYVFWFKIITSKKYYK